MLKFMGAYTQLSPLQAKKLLEVVFQGVYVYYSNNLKVVAIFSICPPKVLAFFLTSSLSHPFVCKHSVLAFNASKLFSRTTRLVLLT